MKNIYIEQTRTKKMNHWMTKPFVPVFEKIVKKETLLSPKLGELLYERDHFHECWNFSPTSIPKKVWPVARIRRSRLGQLRLF